MNDSCAVFLELIGLKMWVCSVSSVFVVATYLALKADLSVSLMFQEGQK